MVCPKCCQPVQVQAEACCPLCGFALQAFTQRLRMLYLLSFALFASTLIYSVLVFFLETRGLARPSSIPAALPYALLAIGVLQLGLARRIGRPLAQLTAMTQVQSLFLVRLALVEAVAVMGLVVYLLTASIHWYVTFLAISWVGFMVVGSQLPRLAQRLAELAVEEGSQ
jgi:hypothetical protein